MLEFPSQDVFLYLVIALMTAKRADFVAIHLGLYCLSKYPFRCFQHTKGSNEPRHVNSNNVAF